MALIIKVRILAPQPVVAKGRTAVMAPRVLQLVAVGNPPPSLLKEVEEPLQGPAEHRGRHVKLQLQTPTYAFNKDRNQYHCERHHAADGAAARAGANTSVLGAADVDLFVPDSPFVFGEADREAKVGLVSIFRLRAGRGPVRGSAAFQVEAVAPGRPSGGAVLLRRSHGA